MSDTIGSALALAVLVVIFVAWFVYDRVASRRARETFVANCEEAIQHGRAQIAILRARLEAEETSDPATSDDPSRRHE